jgi:hypothetical protein
VGYDPDLDVILVAFAGTDTRSTKNWCGSRLGWWDGVWVVVFGWLCLDGWMDGRLFINHIHTNNEQKHRIDDLDGELAPYPWGGDDGCGHCKVRVIFDGICCCANVDTRKCRMSTFAFQCRHQKMSTFAFQCRYQKMSTFEFHDILTANNVGPNRLTDTCIFIFIVGAQGLPLDVQLPAAPAPALAANIEPAAPAKPHLGDRCVVMCIYVYGDQAHTH